MLQKRTDAFEDVALDQDEQRQARLDLARALLDEQADALMAPDDPSPDLSEARHSPYQPHRRPLSAAARRLVRAHLRVEEANQE